MFVRTSFAAACLAGVFAVPAAFADPGAQPPGGESEAGVQPRRGASYKGRIAFKRPQTMTVKVGSGSRLHFRMGFNARCRGGGLGELWMENVAAVESLKVTDGAFSGELTGTVASVGSSGRSARFTWSVSGLFTRGQVATATIDGKAELLKGGRVVTRCTIAKPAPVKLTRAH